MPSTISVLTFLISKVIQHRFAGMVLAYIMQYLGIDYYPFYIIFPTASLLSYGTFYVLDQLKTLFTTRVLQWEDWPVPAYFNREHEPYRYHHKYVHLGAHRGIHTEPKSLESPFYPTHYSRLWEYRFYMEPIIEETDFDFELENMEDMDWINF